MITFLVTLFAGITSLVIASCISILGITDISTDVFRFWPILTLVVSRINGVGGILELLLTILCLGTSFTTVYSKFENRSPDEEKVLGYLSGWIPLIGVIKLTQYKHRQMFY